MIKMALMLFSLMTSTSASARAGSVPECMIEGPLEQVKYQKATSKAPDRYRLTIKIMKVLPAIGEISEDCPKSYPVGSKKAIFLDGDMRPYNVLLTPGVYIRGKVVFDEYLQFTGYEAYDPETLELKK